jgi:uncharacterized spore protein YtfJ
MAGVEVRSEGHMTATDVLHNIGETLGSAANVKAVFGDPITANGKTVVPVAKVAYGFGGGFGAGPNGVQLDRKGEGGGGGGGVRAVPAGVLEITENGTRFVPFVDFKLLTGAFCAGVALGALLLARRH